MTKDDLLVQQNIALRKEINELKIFNENLWRLLVLVSRRLQVSSASVKAAVTSLLIKDIFWDISTQYEFLQTINDSTDKTSDLATLISIISRLQVHKIEINVKPQMIQETLSKMEDNLSRRFKTLKIEVVFPSEGDFVLVDYEYLMVALQLILMAMNENHSPLIPLQVIGEKMQGYWQLEIRGIAPSIHVLVSRISDSLTEEFLKTEQIPAEKVLMVYAAFKLFDLQSIRLQTCKDNSNNAVLRLSIPLYKNAAEDER